jgi:serine protease Do
VIRGDIGVSAQTVSPRLGQALGLDRTWGVVLGDVRPESPGERAGLRAGDLVLALNGKTMENGRQLDVNIYRQPVGTRVSLDILRDGKPKKVEVEVSRRREPDYSELATNESNRIPEIGVLAVPLDDGVREFLPRLRRRTGLLIVAQSGPPGLDDDLQPGDVVHRIGSREVTTLEEARNALKSVPAGSLVALHVERDQTLRYLAVERR